MQASHIPHSLCRGLAPEHRHQVGAWWTALSDDARADLERMCDPGATCEEPPIRLVGRLVDEETRRETRLARQQLFDYIANHEEIQFFLRDVEHHICRAHPAARRVIRTGFLPATFRCPVGSGSCPMRRIVDAAGGKSVAMTAETRPRETLARLRPSTMVLTSSIDYLT